MDCELNECNDIRTSAHTKHHQTTLTKKISIVSSQFSVWYLGSKMLLIELGRLNAHSFHGTDVRPTATYFSFIFHQTKTSDDIPLGEDYPLQGPKNSNLFLEKNFCCAGREVEKKHQC
jgi:hypothetical protein